MLCFDGVFRHSDVWINGVHLGSRANGWIPFQYDISAYLREDSDNVLAVRVDNSRQPAARLVHRVQGFYAPYIWKYVRSGTFVPLG